MSGAYDQYVSQVYCLLEKYANKKNMKKFEQKIKCIVQEAFHLSRRNSEQPFLPASPAEWMSLFYNDTCVTKKFIRNCDRVFFPCKLATDDKLVILKIFNFFSQLPGLTEECFKKFIATLTDSSLEDKNNISAFIKTKISDIYGQLSCGGNERIVTNLTDATENTEVVVLLSGNNNLEPTINHDNHYFVLQSVLSLNCNQEAIDYKTYEKNPKTGLGIYGKVIPKDKIKFDSSDNAEKISEKTTGPKPLSISSLAIKNRRTLICNLLNKKGGAAGSGGGMGGNSEGGGGKSGGGSDSGIVVGDDSKGGGAGDTVVDASDEELQKIIQKIIENNSYNFFYLDFTQRVNDQIPLYALSRSTFSGSGTILEIPLNVYFDYKKLHSTQNFNYYKTKNNDICSFKLTSTSKENLFKSLEEDDSNTDFLKKYSEFNCKKIHNTTL